MENHLLKGLNVISSGRMQKLVVEKLKEFIIESKLSPGDAFPTEKELSGTLGVSRTVIREALKSLETLGVIEVRPGIGRFLREFNVEIFLDYFSYDLELNVRDFKDILEVRICLESSFLAQCIPLYTDDEIAGFERLLATMERKVAEEPAVSEQELIATHTDFHLSLYHRTENSLLLSLIRIFSTIQKKLTLLHRYTTQDRRDFIVLHARLLEAVRERNVPLAQERLHQHFHEAIAWSRMIGREEIQ